MRRTAVALSVCLAVWVASTAGQQAPSAQPPSVPDEVLVKFNPLAPNARRESVIARMNARLLKTFDAVDIHHLKLRPGMTVSAALAALRADPDVVAAEPNYIRTIAQTSPPNDPYWINGSLWGLIKIRAQETWQAYGSGDGSVVVADIDTGVDYNHPDLAANMWHNPGEISGDGIDNDNNGYIDDVYGIDTVNHDTNPMDDHGHGTHTSGTVGAVGNNGIGVTGVNQNVKILACKFIASNGFGPDSAAIECFNYITALRNKGINVRVSNNSWGGTGWNGLLISTIDTAGNAGIINMFAAGNSGQNNEVQPFYPGAYPNASILAVAASDSNDQPAGFSNYGAISTDLAAPGVGILSTYGGGYEYLNGTSMATPHVAGAAALLFSFRPAMTVAAMKAVLMNTADPVQAWIGKTVTGGRLNLFMAAQTLAANPPPSVTLTSPLANAAFSTGSTISLAATATDNGSIAKVDFYRNSTLISTDATAPYTASWSSASSGAYTLTAVATDDLGATTTSAPVNIAVGVPAVLLTPSSLTFAEQAINTQSASQTVTLKNVGATKLVISSFNGVAPTASFTTGDFQVTTTCPLTGAGLAASATCTFTVKFTPTVSGARTASIAIGDNCTGSPHTISLSGTGAPLVSQATATLAAVTGANRLRSLQRADGGWYFHPSDSACNGSTASCYNTLGITAQGLLAAYQRTTDPVVGPELLAAARTAGDRLVQRYQAGANATPPAVPAPFSQDLEFLISLSNVTLDFTYLDAFSWFFATTAPPAGPSATAKVDQLVAERGAEGIRTVAAWDVASLIRDAVAVGQTDYALEAANRIVALESEWKDTNRNHRYGACPNPAGCGPADNPLAYDYTLLAEGSLLWAFHDLGGFTTKIDEYRAFLIQEQDAVGSWDVEDLQITAYAMLGLEAVGGASTSLQKAAFYLVSKQMPLGGWPTWVSGTNSGAENTEIDAEIVRALAGLYNTVQGASVSVAPAQLASVTFTSVTSSGSTTVVGTSDPGGTAHGGVTLLGLNYDIQTTAAFSGDVRVCFSVPWNAVTPRFDDLRVLHAEHGVLIDRTIRQGAFEPDAAAKRICARVSSLGSFALAVADTGRGRK